MPARTACRERPPMTPSPTAAGHAPSTTPGARILAMGEYVENPVAEAFGNVTGLALPATCGTTMPSATTCQRPGVLPVTRCVKATRPEPGRTRRNAAATWKVAASLRRVLPGSGRVALTHRVTGKTPGRWHVVAEGMVVPQVAGRARPVTLPKASATGFSTYSPIARMRAPGVVLGAWPAAVGLGVIGGLSLQAVLAGIHGLPVARVFLLALAASVLGVVGAKVYYRLTHLREKGGLLAAGMSVQGFVLTAVVVFVAGGSAAGVPIGHLLDATVPALLLGQAIGRLGCFFGGCCAGLPTHSRWGLWSSDRRVGTRRIPVQLMESALAGLLALVTGVIALQGPSRGDGLLFVGGLAAYVLGRQLLFPLRGVPRATAHGRQITLAASAVVVLTSIAVAVAG